MSRKIPQIAALAAAVALSGVLAGCGKMGDLERPGPMFGHPSPAREQRPQQQDPNRPVQTIDQRDPNAPTPAPPPNER